MNTLDKDWWTAQAGEYVLGTLDPADRQAFQKAMTHNKDAVELVALWERTFQPLADSLTPKEPAQHVWDAIDDRLFGETVADSTATQLDEHISTVRSLENQVDRWRSYASLATAASLLLVSLSWLTYRIGLDQLPSETVVSVTQFDAISIIRDEESSPLWIVDAALDDGYIRVTAAAPPEIDDSKSYELWIVKPDNAGVQSMGLIPNDIDQSYFLKVSAVDEQPVAFAVSLEPLGGSTQDGPSGPVLYQGEFQRLTYK